jgi:XrtN system VIT domain protein
MRALQSKFQDPLLAVGWLLILCSAGVFCLPMAVPTGSGVIGIFLLNFFCSIVYRVYFLTVKNKVAEHRIHYTFCQLILLLISAFALNRSMDIFAESPLWLSCLLVLLSVNLLFTAVFHAMPKWMQVLQLFLMGVGFVVFGYYALYLLPLYGLSVLALVAIGLSIHTFVPVLICVYTMVLVVRLASGRKILWLPFVGGVAVCIMIATVFSLMWNASVKQVNEAYFHAGSSNAGLPGWVQVAQVTHDHSMAEKVLKSGVMYKDYVLGESMFAMPRMNGLERMQMHDPLVMIACFFSERLAVPSEERIKILSRQYNIRHEAQERYWSGDNLATEHVNSHVRIWPDMHLAYTELVMRVANRGMPGGLQEEAIYTLHMAEGAVVTSLSLWIEGKEQKGILTTKEKAGEAYKAIVGYEARDPSVVHWQEGNTVSIRVFPVLPANSRQFKIGITAPLKKEGDRLVYDNHWFFGPDAGDATEEVTVEMMNTPQSFIRHAVFSPQDQNRFTRRGSYQPRWSLSFREQGMRPHVFTHNGYGYYLKPYNRHRVPVETTDVYLDLNDAWTKDDFEAVWRSVQGKNVWVYDHKMVKLDEGNRHDIFEKMLGRSFSIFPFHEIPDVSRSLVVGRSQVHAPNFSDLEGTSFLSDLKGFAASGRKVRYFHLGGELSSYLRSVKEFRMLEFEQGDVKLLNELLSKGMFVQDVETDDEVIVHSAGLAIARAPGNHPSTAPDHLMRLFAYNHIMKEAGGQLWKADADTSKLVEEARDAYVVTPVSSLIVLETKRDYDRFEIEEKDGSLSNASMGSSGAVPEPHEWALIVLVLAVLFFAWFKIKA